MARVATTRTAQTGWALVAAGMALVAVSYGLARYAYGLYLPALRAEFGLSASVAGMFASASYATFCLAIVGGAALTARGHAYAATLLAGIAATVGMGLIAVAASPVGLGIGVIVAGASAGLVSPPLIALVAAAVRPADHDRAQMIVNAGTGLGVLASGPSVLLATDSWRVAWALFALLSLGVTVVLARTVVTTRAAAGARRPSTAGAAPPRAAVLALGAAAVGLGVTSSACWTFGRDLLTTVGGLDATAAAAVWVTLGGTGVLAAFTGDVVARYRIAAVWFVLLLALAGATAGLTLWPGSLPLALASATLFGAGYIAACGVLVLWACRIAPRRAPSAVAGVCLLISAGQLAGAGAIGALIDFAGWTPAFLAAAGVAVACAPIGALSGRGAGWVTLCSPERPEGRADGLERHRPPP
jgi:predicted MFS family arabinose efflux permease